MPEDWDFYLCQMNGAPASVFVNLALIEHSKTLPETTLYSVRIAMAHPGQHGMGDAEEVEVLGPIEQDLVREATRSGLRYVGRLRHEAHWQLTYMGASGRKDRLEQLVQERLKSDFRKFIVSETLDAQWSYYRDVLYPDRDRLQWIQNRRVVESLEQRCAALNQARQVSHFVYFDDEVSRAAFSKAIVPLGFDVDALPTPGSTNKYGLKLRRNDVVELAHIHEVTMDLTRLALSHGGDYDGWETRVEDTPG